jgi:tetratricopeptide (TPR) repeat protein
MNRVLERPAIVLLLLAAAVVTMLHACWDAPFYKIDDDRYIAMSVRRPLARLFVPMKKHHYAPVTFLSLRMDYVLFGPPLENLGGGSFKQHGIDDVDRAAGLPVRERVDWAWAPRLMNGLYHFLAAVVLWYLLRRLNAGAGVTAFTALGFAVHPIGLESVAWVCERKNVLAALFGFGTLLAWTAHGKRWRWPAVYACFALALLSKTSALGFLPILFFLQIFASPELIERGTGAWKDRRHLVRSALLMVVPTVFSLLMTVLTIQMNKSVVVDPPGGSLVTAIMTDAEIFTRYITNILLPANLSFFYSVQPLVSFLDLRLWLGGFLLLAVFGSMVAAAGKEHRFLCLLGVIWFFSALATNANIIATPFYMQDRYIYLSLPGFLLAMSAGFCGVLNRQPRMTRPLTVLATIYLVMLFVMVGMRSRLFADGDELALDAARRQPCSAIARVNSASVLSDRFKKLRAEGKGNEAVTAAREAIAHYEAVESCPDARLFIDALSARVRRAELLMEIGDYQGGRTTLKGWLPPKDIPMLNVIDEQGRVVMPGQRDYYKGYTPNVLAHGWQLMALASLSQGDAPALAADHGRRMKWYTQALEEIDKSIAAHRQDYEAYLAKAQILGRLRNLSLDMGNQAEADRYTGEFVAALKSIPTPTEKSSPAHRSRWQEAQGILLRLGAN